ncbi:hypothetical protein II906_02325 [bacterium]|nr:hypothetical protein [bacterium]
MQVNNVSFTGMWKIRSEKFVGQVPDNKGNRDIIKRELKYIPFKDESYSEARAEVQKYNNRVVKLDTRDIWSKGCVKYYLNDIKIGKQSKLYSSTNYPPYPTILYQPAIYSVVSKEEEQDILKYVRK